MYYEVVSQCTQSLKLVEGWLDKAEACAKAKNVDVDSLLNGTLAPDMKPLIYQVQSACDYVKAGAAWLSGQRPPRHEDIEKTVEELRAFAFIRRSTLCKASLKISTKAPKADWSVCRGRRERSWAARTIFSR